MEEAAIIEQLTLFGLSRQEAAIYLCLLHADTLSSLYDISLVSCHNGLNA